MQRDHRKSRNLSALAGFILSGLLSFVVDAGVMLALIHWAGLSPFAARIPSILTAMVAGWLSNRRLTFRVATPPGLMEFLRYALASGTAIAVNYAVFAALLAFLPATPPLVALIIGSGVAAGISYTGYRWFVFKK